MALLKCPCAFRLRKLTQNAGPGIGVRHFSPNFPHKMALVTCPCAFRLHRLAQSVLPGLRIGFLPVQTPGPKKVQLLGPSTSTLSVLYNSLNSVATLRVLLVRAKARWLIDMVSGMSGIFTCKFLPKMGLVTCPCAFRLSKLAQNGSCAWGIRHFTGKFPH